MKIARYGRCAIAAAAVALCIGCEIREVPSGPAASANAAAGGASSGTQTVDSRGVARVARGRLTFIDGFQAGLELARQQHKPMLVFFTAEWCHYCHQLADEAFVHDAVVEMSGQFVCVLVDADAEPGVCREFHVRGYPTIQFLSPSGVPLNRVTGKQPGHALAHEMQAALQVVARQGKTITR